MNKFVERRYYMGYSRWAEKNELKNILTKINMDGEIKTSGLPVMYDGDMYIDSRNNHSLIIGTNESCKTESIIIPKLELCRKAGESVIVHDSKKEIYNQTYKKFEESGYNVIKLEFDNPNNSNYWNPFDLIQKIYNIGNIDVTQKLIEDIGFYLLYTKTNLNVDSFWNNSAVDYFTGLIFYMLNENIELNLNNISEVNLLIQEKPKDFINKIDKNSNIYINLIGVLNAPLETMGSIFSVFNQKIKRFISRQSLINVLSKSDFDIEKISEEKTIIYVISGSSNNSEYLFPILVSQLYYSLENNNNIKRVNIVIDDFGIFNPIKNFDKILNYSVNINMLFTVFINGYNELKNIYGKEQSEIIKMCFTNILYLLSKDLDTLNEISKFCGSDKNGPLISVEELKTLEMYEAIYITLRIMPFKTKLYQ